MSGYLHFTRTGVESVDNLLAALTRAGHLFHHTAEWQDPWPTETDPSPLDGIQKAADGIAAALRAPQPSDIERERVRWQLQAQDNELLTARLTQQIEATEAAVEIVRLRGDEIVRLERERDETLARTPCAVVEAAQRERPAVWRQLGAWLRTRCGEGGPWDTDDPPVLAQIAASVEALADALDGAAPTASPLSPDDLARVLKSALVMRSLLRPVWDYAAGISFERRAEIKAAMDEYDAALARLTPTTLGR